MSRRRGYSRDALGLADSLSAAMASYDAMKASRFRKKLTGVAAMGSGADFHYRSERDYLRMMELARDVDRNDMVVGQGLTRFIDNGLQDGMKVDPQTGDVQINADLLPRWNEWSQNPNACDRAGELDFHMQERLTARAVVVDGDILHLGLEDGSLETVEGHRLRTPQRTTKNVVLGVLMNSFRQKLEYWITREDVGFSTPIKHVREIKAYPARDSEGNLQIFHVRDPKRMTQTRGITAFAPIIDAIGMHGDLQFAHLVQAQMASCIAILRERELESPSGKNAQLGNRETKTREDGTTETIEGFHPGLYINGLPGEKLTGFSPNIPNPEFFPHAKLILTFIAINLGIPVHVLLLDPSDTNFSGWRGAIDQARFGFKRFQNILIRFFHKPVYEWKVRQWMAEDRALQNASNKSDINMLGHRWKRPAWSYIEPLKDATGDKTILSNGLNSPRRVQDKLGQDWKLVALEIVEDHALMVREALRVAAEIKTEYPEADVDWRDLARMSSTTKPTTVAKTDPSKPA